MDSFYHRENLCLEGLRMLYFPLDNSYDEYVKANCSFQTTFGDKKDNNIGTEIVRLREPYFKNGFNFFVYVLNAPSKSSCFKLDIYCNFEVNHQKY